jgi:hypothetical protein
MEERRRRDGEDVEVPSISTGGAAMNAIIKKRCSISPN